VRWHCDRFYSFRDAMSSDLACTVFREQNEQPFTGHSDATLLELATFFAGRLIEHLRRLHLDGAHSVHVLFDGARSDLKIKRHWQQER
jgi:hypothetical protein